MLNLLMLIKALKNRWNRTVATREIVPVMESAERQYEQGWEISSKDEVKIEEIKEEEVKTDPKALIDDHLQLPTIKKPRYKSTSTLVEVKDFELTLEENISNFMLYIIIQPHDDFEHAKRDLRFSFNFVLLAALLTPLIQIGLLAMMLYEIDSALSFYHTDVTHYILLRYVLIILSAFLVVSEYYDIATELFVLKKLKNKIEASGFYFFIFFAISFLLKAVLAVLSQITICFIVVTSHLGQEKGIGLILNFTAGVIIIEIENIIVKGFVND